MFPVGESTTPIWAHAKDYGLYMEEETKHHTISDSAVFIDEYIPYHRDLAALGIPSPIGGSVYYAMLRRFFDRIEAEFSLRVIVAACPRANYDDKPGLFGDREVVFFKTAQLIASSKLVLAHRSTAINFAVLFRKPILLVTTKQLYRSHHRPYLNGFSMALGLPLQFMDDVRSMDLKHALHINTQAYESFQEDYIKTTASPAAPFWEIVMSAIESTQGLANGNPAQCGHHESSLRV